MFLTFFSGKWQRNKYVGVSLVGKTLAVMGFGKVGSEVARRAKGLGMHVIAHDPYAPADRARAIGVDLVSFDQAISTADFISLHMPLTPTTNKIFNDDTFAKMKKGVRVINVARGGVIDEDALVRALDSGTVAQVIHFFRSLEDIMCRMRDILGSSDISGLVMDLFIENEMALSSSFK